MIGTYNKNFPQLPPGRSDVPIMVQHEGKQYVRFYGKYYTYDQWKEMERKVSVSTDT